MATSSSNDDEKVWAGKTASLTISSDSSDSESESTVSNDGLQPILYNQQMGCSFNATEVRTMESCTAEELAKFPEAYKSLTSMPVTAYQYLDRTEAMINLVWGEAERRSSIPIAVEASLTFLEIKNSNALFVVQCEKPIEATGHKLIGLSIIVNYVNKIGAFEATVIESNGRALRIKLNCQDSDTTQYNQIQNEIVTIKEYVNDFVWESAIGSVNQIRMFGPQSIIWPQTIENEDEQTMAQIDYHSFGSFLLANFEVTDQLTESQKLTVFSICNNTNGNRPFVLNGPPGTGKTVTVCAAVDLLLKNKHNRILICAPSNKAADNIAEKLVSRRGPRELLRLNAKSRDFNDRNCHLDQIILIYFKSQTYRYPLNQTEWLKYRVVISTLAATAVISFIGKGHFTHIFVDEAGQANEWDFIIPIGRFATESTSVILCGDPKQLQPVLSEDIPSIVAEKNTSTLHRLMGLHLYKNDGILTRQLVDCFRCPASVTAFASAFFYDFRLNCSGNHWTRNFELFGLCGLTQNFRILFIDVGGKEEKLHGGSSFCNRQESVVVAKLIDRVCNRYEMSTSDVGIICPYNNQCDVVKREVRKVMTPDRLSQLQISSVESFQGSERKVIIMSTVRTTNLGFVGNRERINTAITRAQEVLIVVGCKNALKKFPELKSFVEYCNQNDSSFNWNDIAESVDQ